MERQSSEARIIANLKKVQRILPDWGRLTDVIRQLESQILLEDLGYEIPSETSFIALREAEAIWQQFVRDTLECSLIK